MNELKRIDEFRQVLTSYEPSKEARQILQDISLVLLVGPSSSGRNTIINELVKSGLYYFVVSDTTRQPRTNNGVSEQNGREYWFRTEEEVLTDLKAGEFLEAAIIHNQQVSGISVRELKVALAEHKIAIDEIEAVGADNIHAVSPKAQFLFVLPPSFDEWITRMNARGELPAAETKRRLESAVMEIATALDRDYYRFVVNDTFMHATRLVNAMIRENFNDADKESVAREVAKEILTDTRQFLADLPHS